MLGTLVYWKGFVSIPLPNAISLFHITIVINFVINLVSSGFRYYLLLTLSFYKIHMISAIVIACGSVTAFAGLSGGYQWAGMIMIGLAICGISHATRLWLVQKQVACVFNVACEYDSAIV